LWGPDYSWEDVAMAYSEQHGHTHADVYGSDGLMSVADKTKLDSITVQDIADNAVAITAEATTARAAEQANQNAITAEATTARAAEQANASAIAALTNGAPELLNTLAELSSALGDDPDLAGTITGQLSQKASTASVSSALAQKASTAVASDQANGLMSVADKTKLDSITVQDIADNKSKLAGIADNANYYELPDNIPTNAVATDSADGLMSAADKVKLDANTNKLADIDENANYYVLPSLTNNHIHSDAHISARKIDVSGTPLDDVLEQKASTDLATTVGNGLMSAQDKTNLTNNSIKLANIADNANRYVLPSLKNDHIAADAAIDASKIDASGTSLNVVLGQKASTAIASDQANGLMSKDDWSKLDSITVQDITDNKSKLAGIPANANYYVLPSNIPTDAVASESADGLMSKDDYSKLDGIPENANYYVLPDNIPTNQIASETQKGLMSAADKVKLEANTAKVGVSLADDPGGLTLVDDKLSAADTLASANTYTNTAISDIVDWSVTGTEDIHPDRYTNTTYTADGSTLYLYNSQFKVAGGGIENDHIAVDAVTGSKIADGVVTNTHIADSTITGYKMVNYTITGSKIANDAITAAQIADGAVTGSKIANDAITAAQIADGAVDARRLYNSSNSWGIYTVNWKSNVIFKVHTLEVVTIVQSSDSRIKENIVDVPDSLALQKVRDIPCRYYEYKDKQMHGNDRVVGFIAQEVDTVFPEAVKKGTDIIPDHLRLAQTSWVQNDDEWKMTVSNLMNDVVPGTKLQFKCGENESNTENFTVEMNSDKSFTMKGKYAYVYVIGRQVGDFHTLNKSRIFALHHSAIQELDRKVQEQEATIAALMERLAALEAKVQ